jgi:uncharacterized membrane protein
MFLAFQIIQLILGALMWTLIGQGALAVLAGKRREADFVYRFFALVTWPVFRLTRLIAPHFVADRHIGFLALFLIVALRVGVYMVFAYHGWIPPIRPAPGP